MARGFGYLAVVLDWATRRILAWRLSNSLTADAPVEALEEAIAKYGTPEIMNTDQGSQFTSSEFIGTLERHGIAISMDGKGCWRDKAYASHCTSFAASETTFGSGCLSESLVPCALRGASAPGGSNKHSFLSL